MKNGPCGTAGTSIRTRRSSVAAVGLVELSWSASHQSDLCHNWEGLKLNMETSSAAGPDTRSFAPRYLFDLVGLGHLDRHDPGEQNTLF